jgi:prepilin signal peptidase PulO-like enzyme (type II secretory pathway)
MNPLELIIAFLFGTVWGSFFYTLALRLISGEIKKSPVKALFTRSRCPSCGKHISLLFLVPIFGYLMQKGKCRKCGSKIPIIYPLVEILYGLLLAAVVLKLGISVMSFNIYLLICLSMAIAIIDMKILTIPDSLVIAFVLLSIYPIFTTETLANHFFGLLVLSLFFLTILLIFPGGFGGGDLKFAAATGLLFGLELSIVVLEVSLISGALAGMVYIVAARKSLRTKMPFGPFLTIGQIVAFLYGQEILLIYYRYVG